MHPRPGARMGAERVGLVYHDEGVSAECLGDQVEVVLGASVGIEVEGEAPEGFERFDAHWGAPVARTPGAILRVPVALVWGEFVV